MHSTVIEPNRQWLEAGPVDQVREVGKKILKIGGRQILLIHHQGRFYACNNRCPHQGFPLSEGTLSGNCVLTCNWHNWKFDLSTGTVLNYSGDRLRTYPVAVREGQLWIDVTPLAPEAEQARALGSLHEAMQDSRNRLEDYSRQARELARYQHAGGDLEVALAHAVTWTHEHLEDGITHAHAMAPDWLALSDRTSDPVKKLTAIVEIVHYLGTLFQEPKTFPYATATAPYDSAAFLKAIENEDEPSAIALVRGAIAQGLRFNDLESGFAKAALSHYAGFGHAVIYVVKIGEWLRRGFHGDPLTLILPLVRTLVTARREDLLPEFRHYQSARTAWSGTGTSPVTASDFKGLGIKAALNRALESSARIDELYAALLHAVANNMLHYDLSREDAVVVNFAHDADWLDVTHAITFANAGRILAEKHPALWPDLLLQMACWVGRNAGHVNWGLDTTAWHVSDPETHFAEAQEKLFNHRCDRPIVAAHLVKTSLAIESEYRANPMALYIPTLLAAHNRFLNSPVRFHRPLRAAWQALDFTGQE